MNSLHSESEDPRYRFAVDVVRRLRKEGHEALWAGGCVRDQLLGKLPKDYDVASTATPDEVIQIFGRRRTVAVGASFGVVMVLGPDKAAGQIEVATFRSDGEYLDGRRPSSVSFCRPEEDAHRRDFTINGMFFDPLEERIIDYVGGLEDLAAGIVRAIGDPVARFTEDKLRMLRAVRFTATFGFALDEATAAAVRQLRQQICQVSEERITQELKRMLSHSSRALSFELLNQTALLAEILPELCGVVEFDQIGVDALMRHALEIDAVKNKSPFSPEIGGEGGRRPDEGADLGVNSGSLNLDNLSPPYPSPLPRGESVTVESSMRGRGDNRKTTDDISSDLVNNKSTIATICAQLRHLQSNDFEPALVLVLLPLRHSPDERQSSAAIESVCRRLKLSNEETECICWLAESLSILDGIRAKALHVLKPLLAHPYSERLLQLSAAISAAEGRQADEVQFCRDYLSEMNRHDMCPAPFVNGQDLMDLNVPQGPEFRVLLTRIRNEQLDEILTTRTAALERLRELVNARVVG